MTDVPALVDAKALEAYINAKVPGRPGTITLKKHVAGFSNETFFVDRGDEHWVMRRPPAGPLLPTAHDVSREFRFINALYGRARVPKPVLHCDDPAVIGAPFYLMDRVDGAIIRGEIPAAYNTDDGRRRITEEMVDSLAEMHMVDWRAAGIEGREGGYIQRQLKRWSGQWELTRKRTRELEGLDRLTRWLQEYPIEEGPSTVVHGDYKLDNVVFDHNEPKLLAILDWEMATIGDPLADLGYFMNTFAVEPPPPGYENRAPERTLVGSSRGWLTIDEIAARYEQKTGRSMKDFLFYRILAHYKLIVILEGLYMHYIEGTAANPGAADFEWGVPMRVAAAQQIIDRARG